MPSETIVIALGGNSLLSSGNKFSIHQEIKNIKESCRVIAGIVKSGYRIVLTHGNGPQVGDLMIAQESAKGKVPELPLDVLGAQTQGELGYLIQRTLRKHLPGRNIVTVVTQVAVKDDDPAFGNPTKFVGPFLSSRPEQSRGRAYMKDSDRGYRRVVPSPDPVEIIEKKEIKRLVESGFVVIACGGGGIPVTRARSELKGVEGVIDKDLASQRLATSLGARTMMIITDVPCAFAHYGTRLQKELRKLTVKEAEVYTLGGHFPPGSMGPKIEASIRFLKKGGRRAIITDRENALSALRGKGGTVISR
jgi:carbamate kinase